MRTVHRCFAPEVRPKCKRVSHEGVPLPRKKVTAGAVHPQGTVPLMRPKIVRPFVLHGLDLITALRIFGFIAGGKRPMAVISLVNGNVYKRKE
jgi:hypothetical protein